MHYYLKIIIVRSKKVLIIKNQSMRDNRAKQYSHIHQTVRKNYVELLQYGGSKSEQLRHVQIWTVNQQQCANSYRNIGFNVTSNMLCAGWFGVGGRDQCQNDAGGPLIHNSVVVGISSWGYQCGLPFYPGINTRVSRFTTWIQDNA